MLVADIYNTSILPIDQRISIAEALHILIEKDFNCLLVVNKEQKLSGILSIQDIAGSIVPSEFENNTKLADALYKPDFFQELCKEAKIKSVESVMRKKFITVTPETSILEIAADFLHNDLYIVPVLSDGELVGIVTRSELKKALAKGFKAQT